MSRAPRDRTKGATLATPNLFKRGQTYWWREMIGGVQYRRSTGHTDYDLAKDKAREFARAVRAGETEKPVEMPTFGAWVLKYFSDAHGAKARQGAMERDPPLLRPAVKAWADKPLDKIRRPDCENLMVGMLATTGAFGTVWLRCIRTKMMFRLAIDAGLLKTNPWKGVKLPKPAHRERVMQRDEEAVLKEKLGPQWSRLITVAVGTGMRPGELVKLKPEHRVEGFLRLPAAITKGHKARTIPLRPEVERALDEQAQLLGPSKRYWACERQTATKALRDMVTALGWERLTLHDMRRTFGTRCAEAGMDMVFLQQIMGHEDIATTRDFYVHLSENSLKDSLLKLNI